MKCGLAQARAAGYEVTDDALRRGRERQDFLRQPFGRDFAVPFFDFDANGLLAPVTVTAQDHGGGGKTRIEMWDGQK